MALFTAKLRQLLFGNPFGEVFPPQQAPNPLSIDGRTAALHVLREYLAAQVFFRSMGPNVPPKPFQISEKNIQIEWPDSEYDEVMPSINIRGSRGRYDVIGLVAYIEEDTRDRYAPGTVLQWQAEYVETINIEVWASKKSERRAILAALEPAFSPTEVMSGIRFKMPEYYDELVVFSLNARELMDGENSARDRRSAQLEVEMRHNIVALVNYASLTPSIKVNTDVDLDTMLPVDVSDSSP